MSNHSLHKKLFSATGIGSLPHQDAGAACQFILSNFQQDIIFWPQLVKRSFLENMYVQFSEGLPAVVVEKDKQRIYIDTAGKNFLSEIQNSLDACLSMNAEYFSISEDYAAGFYEILREIKGEDKINNFKGQIIGPLSFGLTVKDESSRPVFYNRELQEVITKSLALKASWQIRQIKKSLPQAQVIIFIDEPYLVSIGSSYIPLKREEVVSQINELVKAIHGEGAIAGIHCCGNTDWGLVIDTQVDILNFDAYNFLDSLLIYQKQLKDFFGRGGILAWGIVPTSGAITAYTKEPQYYLLKNQLAEAIRNKGEEKGILKNQVLITTSCGCGTLGENLSERLLKMSVEVAQVLNAQKIL